MSGRRIDGTVFQTEGNGPPVVLVHGLGLDRNMWTWQIDALAGRFFLVRYDLLGHGESDKPPGPYPMERFVDQLSALVDGLKLDKMGLVGFSLGGLIVQAFTLAHPGRVSALAILNAAHNRTGAQRAAVLERVDQAVRSGPQATVEAALERWFTADFARRRPNVLDQVRQWVIANDPRVYPEIYRLLAEGDADLADAVREIRCPTLVMTGEEDFGNSPEMAERLAELVPGAQVVIVPGVRHMGLVENPDAFASVLVPFLEGALRGEGEAIK